MKYVYFSNSTMVAVTNLETGEMTQFFNDDPRYQRALDLVKDGLYQEVEAMNTKVTIETFAGKSTDQETSISIEDNVGYITTNGYKTALSDVLVKRIIQMVSEGFEPQPMINFIQKLYQNPSHTAVNELFLFLDKAQLPITEDGHFIAYKIVQNDYKDIYTGKMDNSVGQIVAMPRNEVDDKRENTCSKGLHFCSRDYLSSYGSSNRDTDRCVLVKINPADVVSIPSDYDNAKGRTWRYEVIGEVASGWRHTLPNQDYTSASVVGEDGKEYDLNYESEYYFDSSVQRYRRKSDGRLVKKSDVI